MLNYIWGFIIIISIVVGAATGNLTNVTNAAISSAKEAITLGLTMLGVCAMCTFLIINISSVQLISINMIAYRIQYGSLNPTEIVGPSIIATLGSTIAGIIYSKIMARTVPRSMGGLKK